MNKKFGFALQLGMVLCWLLLLPNASAEPSPTCTPYIGERMVFSIGWEFINGGTAEMRVAAKGPDGYRITTFARSNKFLDLFHKVRDRIVPEGVCIDGRMQSELFDIEQHEVKYHGKKRAEFKWREGRVLYTQHNRTDTYEVPKGHLDVIDAFFATRSLPLKIGKTVRLPVFDSRKSYELHVNVLKKERIRAPWRKYVECLVVEPKMKTTGIFTTKAKIKVWLTNDARRIPLKMTAKLKFGRIVARLTDYSRK